MEIKDTIVELCPILIYLSLHPFVLEATTSAISQACIYLCELAFVWRIEVVEVHVEGLGFSISTRCRQRLSFVSLFILIEISIACVIKNILIHGCNCFVYVMECNMLY